MKRASRGADAELRRKNALLTALNEYSLTLAAVPYSDDVYAVVASKLKSLADAVAVGVSVYDERSQALTLRHTTLTEAESSLILRVLGRRLEGMRFTVTPANYARMIQEVVGDAGTLNETTFGGIASTLGTVIERTLGVKWFTGVALLHEGALVGTLVIAGRDLETRPDNEELRAFAGVTANALRRWSVEREKVAQEAEFRFMTETMYDVIWRLSPDFVFTYVSPSTRRMFGYTPQEVVGQSLFAFLTERSTAAITRLIAERREHRERGEAMENLVVEVEQRHRDGSTVHTEVSVSPYHDAHGVLLGFQGVTRDVSERKRAEIERDQLEARLHQALKLEAIGRLAGGIAHDFNNLLMGILGNLELVVDELEPQDAHRDALEEVRTAAESAAALTKQLLAFSQRHVIQPTELDLTALLEELAPLFARLTREDVKLVWQLGRELPPVFVDRGQVEQVCLNLLMNAQDALGSGGEVVVTTATVTFDARAREEHPEAEYDRYVLLRVADTGTGMDAETMTRLFEPFYTTKPVGHGTGLGLAATYGAVKQAQGFIEVESALGTGSVFSVYLPAASALARPRGSTPAAGAALSGRPTVLLVEDEHVVRHAARRILTQLGYRVLEASSGAAALHLLEDDVGELDLLITDVEMPGMTGRELARRVKAVRPAVPVLFTSGYTAEAVLPKTPAQADVGFLAKPFSADTLSAAVTALLRPGSR